MNIRVKYGSCQNLDEIFGKDIFIKLLSKCKDQFEIYRKLWTSSIKNNFIRNNNIIPFPNEQKNSLFSNHMLSNNLLKVGIASICVFMLISLFGMSFSNAEKPTANYLDIQVHSGDTVWTIASQYASNKEDLREYVFAIKTINGLNNNALIYSGQTLRVPAPTN